MWESEFLVCLVSGKKFVLESLVINLENLEKGGCGLYSGRWIWGHERILPQEKAKHSSFVRGLIVDKLKKERVVKKRKWIFGQTFQNKYKTKIGVETARIIIVSKSAFIFLNISANGYL